MKKYFKIFLIFVLVIAGFLVWRNFKTGPGFTQTVSNKYISFEVPIGFGLAVNKAQITVRSYIPPCSDNFDYCLYYTAKNYADTNFESAGLRIQNRPDITTEDKCLNTEPDGFTNLLPTIKNSDNYSTSVFATIGDAGAGHFSEGKLYRLYSNGQCYEFETRIGQTQFLNYPAGTIKEFTPADNQIINNLLLEIMNNIKLATGEKVSF